MGCAPSHADIIASLTKSGIQWFKKPKVISPGPCGDTEGDSIPPLAPNPTCYDPRGSLSWRQTWTEQLLESKTMQATAEGLGWLPRDPTAIQRKVLETLIPGSKTSPSRLNTSQSAMAAGDPLKTQSSGQDFEESRVQETSVWNRKGRGHSWDAQTQDCQTVLPAPGCQGQVDFPESLVRAHRHAYTYLHSSLSKYETILTITQQAYQTQELLQPMAGFLLRCFEEVNRLLGEISREGDALLQNMERALAWPREKGEPREQPPLLPQLLQHTASKLQALQRAAASLTSSLAQGSRGCLHAMAGQLEEKLSTKQGVDKHLLRTLGQLEDLASGSRDPRGQGLPLCSEDSGIGADTEPVPAGDKLGQWASCDSVPELGSVASPPGGPRPSGPTQLPGPIQHCPFSRPPGAKVQPTSEQTSGVPGSPSSVPKMGAPQWLGLNLGTLGGAPPSVTSALPPLPKGSWRRDTPSLSEGGDSSSEEEGEEVSDACPGAWQEAGSHPRPRSSPAGSESVWPTQPSRLRGPQAQELILRVQEAISERIKFVPAASGHPDWAEEEKEEEEEETTAGAPQPSTGRGDRGLQHRRPQSEPCVRSHAGDLTFQPLPRGQRDPRLRPDVCHTLGTRWPQGQDQDRGPQQPQAVMQKPAGRVASPSGLSKLKASLTQHLSILPSQDRSAPRSLRPEGNQPHGAGAGALPPGTPPGEKARDVTWARDENVGGPLPRTSVKKLIETFSPPESRKALRCSGPRPSLRKWGVPLMPPRFPVYRGLSPLYPKPQISPADRRFPQVGPGPCVAVFPPLLTTGPSPEADESPDFLPPPPLEILMDTSFTSLEAPEGSELAGPSHIGVPLARLEGACPKLRASPSPTLLPASRGAAPNSTKAGGAGLGTSKGSCRPRKLPVGLHLPPAASRNVETEQSRAQRQARPNRATAWRHPRKAVPWHPGSHMLLQTKASAPSLARPPPPPRPPDAPTHSQGRSPPGPRKASPTRSTGTPPEVKRHPSLAPARVNPPASPCPPLCPLERPGPLSPPRVGKRLSPPLQHGLPSPPPGSPPAPHQTPGCSSRCSEVNPPSSSPPPSPGESPAQGHKETRSSAGGEADPANTPRNTCPIFCPASNSLFEAQPPSPAAPPPPPPPPGSPPRSWRHSPGAARRGVSQRLIRRTASDCQPGGHPLPPVPGAPSPARASPLGQSSSREDGPAAPELKGRGRAASAPELCVLGRRLHLEASTGHRKGPDRLARGHTDARWP